MGGGGFAWPADAHSLSGNDYWSGHLGIDIAAGEGAPVYAADSGVVTMATGGYNYGYGNVIQIDHGNGYSTVYAHLSYIGVGVCRKRWCRAMDRRVPGIQAIHRARICTSKSGRTAGLSIPGLYYLNSETLKVRLKDLLGLFDFPWIKTNLRKSLQASIGRYSLFRFHRFDEQRSPCLGNERRKGPVAGDRR